MLIDLSGFSLPLTAEGLFGVSVPLEVELGVGKGRFLVDWAAAHPERGVVGVERCSKYTAMAAARAARRGVANVRIIRTTAEDLLFRCLQPASVAAIHVYFPDPWPKHRHAKRRLFVPGNVERMSDVLEPGGLLLIKTDHEVYARVISTLLATRPALLQAAGEELFAEVPQSSFEGKYDREGRPIFRFACRKVKLGETRR